MKRQLPWSHWHFTMNMICFAFDRVLNKPWNNCWGYNSTLELLFWNCKNLFMKNMGSSSEDGKVALKVLRVRGEKLISSIAPCTEVIPHPQPSTHTNTHTYICLSCVCPFCFYLVIMITKIFILGFSHTWTFTILSSHHQIPTFPFPTPILGLSLRKAFFLSSSQSLTW